MFDKIYRYDKLSAMPTQVSTWSGDIYGMAFDSAGNLYAATRDDGLLQWNGNKWTTFPSLAGTDQKTFMWDISTDPMGRLWITQSLNYATPTLTLWTNGAPQQNFYYGIPYANFMASDRQGNLWFTGYGRLLTRKNAVDGSIDHFEMFNIPDNAFSQNQLAFAPGAGEDLWLRIHDNTLLHFDGDNWSPFTVPSLPQNIEGFCVDSKGRLYVSGYSAPDYKHELKYCTPGSNTGWTKVDFSIFGNWNNRIENLAVDEADNLWFVSSKGLGKRNASDGSLEIYPLPGMSGFIHLPQIRTGPANQIYVLEIDDSWVTDQSRVLQFNSATAEWRDIMFPVPFGHHSTFNAVIWHVDIQNRVWVSISINPDIPHTISHWFWEDGVWTEMPNVPEGVSAIASDRSGNVYLGSHSFLARFKTAGRIEGFVNKDVDSNCQSSTIDPPLPGIAVVAADGPNQYLGLSRSDGAYRLYTGSDRVTVSAIPPNRLWEACVPNGTAVVITNPEQPVPLHLLLQPRVECPHMTVDVSVPFLRRCFDNTYTVRACNDGTAPAVGTYVDITLPLEMDLNSANKPYQSIAPQQYRFRLGDLAIGDCSVFQFVAKVNCDNTTIGQTLCVLAQVYPDTLCVDPASQWKGATVLLDARCDGDSLRFSLKNTGYAATTQAVNYQLLRNEEPFSTNAFGLNPGETHLVMAPADGATWRLEATQEPAHPFLPRHPSLALEACGGKTDLTNQGFVNNRPNSSGSEYEDLDCREIIGAWDPNDKTASPAGVGARTHFIAPATPLEYHIRFQNTGTDTAFTVVVRDTLDHSLDLGSFEPGASSHSYRLDIRGNALAFVFENILLPDSNLNRAASQGFVNFRIRPQRDLPMGTLVTNIAAIYFDFNPAVVTNTVWHVVDSSALQTTAVGDAWVDQGPTLQLKVFPNPAENRFWVQTPAENGILEVYDTQGRLQVRIVVKDTSGPVAVSCAHLPDGVYGLRFIGEQRATSMGGRAVLSH